ncbi:MAG: FHA domain-containing protein [Candidatus Eisenbacteria bacterium]
MSQLRVNDGGSEHMVTLGDGAVRLGRSPECDIVLEDPGISREHAELVRTGEGWEVRDLGSRNGTFVNDEQVDRRRLSPGDVVRLGPDVTLELLHSAQPATPARRATTGSQRADRAARGGHKADKTMTGNWLQGQRWTLTPRATHGRTVSLTQAVTTVGRDPGAGLVLNDESVSRMHARLDREGEALFVTDLKSSNGTHVNDEPVLRAPLKPGDDLRFGDVAYHLDRRLQLAWGRIALAVGAIVAVIAMVFVAMRLSDSMGERSEVADLAKRVRTQALDATSAGIAAARAGDAEMARAHLLYAADLLLLSGLAPRGATLAKPAEVFREVARQLPPDEREFEFARALDPSTLEASQAQLASLTNREYVQHQIQRYSVELGQDPDVPPGFVEAVNGYVEEFVKYKGSMKQMLERSRTMQPRIRTILATRHLPEAFCYVSWVESRLDPSQKSPVGALGLWQFMPGTAREYKLVVDEGNPARDERTNVERSTAAAADYFATLLRDQGPEYFMLVLASYNRGHNALDRAKQKITDPMLRSTRKYWYLVEHELLPEETRNYVPKIFAVRIIAEAPERFGFEKP